MIPHGWKRERFGNIAEFKNGLNFTNADNGEKIKIVGVGDFKGFSQLEKTEHLQTIQVANKIRDEELLQSGDLLFVRSNGNKDLIGRCLFFPLVKERLAYSGFTIRGRVNKAAIQPEYASYLARSSLIKQQILKNGGGTNISNLSQQILNDIFFGLPPLPEQKKIAQILSTWDKAITTTEQLLANSQQQKKALMQQLLMGKKRFDFEDNSFKFKEVRYGKIPSDWGFPAIKEICEQVSGKNVDQSNHPVLSCSKHEGFVDSLKYFKKKVYSDDTSGYRIIPRDCFGFPSNHIEEGSIGLQNLYDIGIVSPIYIIFKANQTKINNNYLFAILKTDHYRQIFSASTNASVDRRGSLRWDDFSSIHVPLPSLEEQNKIVSVLSAADREIEVFQQKLEGLKQEKKALMQQLLTGKRRVNV